MNASPDPTALAILLAAITEGQLVLGLATVVVFSLGFASALVAVGVIAAQVGQRVLRWLSSIWVVRLQLATTLLILGVPLLPVWGVPPARAEALYAFDERVATIEFTVSHLGLFTSHGRFGKFPSGHASWSMWTPAQ